MSFWRIWVEAKGKGLRQIGMYQSLQERQQGREQKRRGEKVEGNFQGEFREIIEILDGDDNGSEVVAKVDELVKKVEGKVLDDYKKQIKDEE